MELTIIDQKGKKTSRKAELSDSVFAVTPNEHAIYLDVKQYLAHQRQGTSSARERSEVRGSRRKLKKQKGSGGARMGDIKNPLLRGGGRVFGPRPAEHGFKLNKKLKQSARRSALSVKASENAISVIEDFKFEVAKTKNYAAFLGNLKLSGKKTLLVLSEQDKNIYLSSRNLVGASVVIASELSTYTILNANNLLLSESSVAVIEKSLS